MIIHRYSLCDTVGSNCCGTSSLHTGYSQRWFQGYVWMGSFVHDLSSGHRLFSSLKFHFLMTRQVVQISNAFILEFLSLHPASSRARSSLLQFKLEPAKQLIGGFCGRKRYPGIKRKFASQDNAIAPGNI